MTDNAKKILEDVANINPRLTQVGSGVKMWECPVCLGTDYGVNRAPGVPTHVRTCPVRRAKELLRSQSA